MYRETASRVTRADDRLVLLCGVAVGYEKEDATPLWTERAEVVETVSFIGTGSPIVHDPQPSGADATAAHSDRRGWLRTPRRSLPSAALVVGPASERRKLRA